MITNRDRRRLNVRGYVLDANIQVRCRRATLAGLAAVFYQKGGQVLQSKSEVIRHAMEVLMDSFEKHGMGQRPETADEATMVLNAVGIELGRRSDQGYMKQLQRENYEYEGLPASATTSRPIRRSQVDEADMDAEIKKGYDSYIENEQNKAPSQTYDEIAKHRALTDAQQLAEAKDELGKAPSND